MSTRINTPIYHESGSHARKFGELEQFKASHWANIDCKKDIEKAISSHFDGFRLDRKCIDEVMEKCEEEYGFKFEFDEDAFRAENGYDPDDEIDEDDIEDAKSDAFYDWVEEYRAGLDDEDKEVRFLSDVFGIEPEMDGVDYEVEIPEEIVELAKA